MKVTWLPDAETRPRHVAVGEFDGVHLGHREVIRGADTVLTFEPHPRQVVAPDAAPKLLTSLDIKTDLIAGLGVRELVVIPFDRSFAAQGPQEFIDDVLVGQLGATKVSVGENFRFGHKAKGDADLLRAQTAFEPRVVPLVEVDGEIVSSTHIRGLVVAGDLEQANRFLGSPFQLRGPVQHGDERGRDARLPDRQPRPGERARLPEQRRLRLPRRGRGGRRVALVAGRHERRRAPDLRHRPRRARRGLPARLRRRSLRPRAAARVPRPAPRRAALRYASRRWWSRCTATWATRGPSPREAASLPRRT